MIETKTVVKANLCEIVEIEMKNMTNRLKRDISLQTDEQLNEILTSGLDTYQTGLTAIEECNEEIKQQTRMRDSIQRQCDDITDQINLIKAEQRRRTI